MYALRGDCGRSGNDLLDRITTRYADDMLKSQNVVCGTWDLLFTTINSRGGEREGSGDKVQGFSSTRKHVTSLDALARSHLFAASAQQTKSCRLF
jgi:hypothetical protein